MVHIARSSILRRLFGKRCFHTTQIVRLDPKTVEEVKIPVPWGHIAGKWWGPKQSQPVIAIHGFLDNAGSFDALLPLLNTECVLCLDLPGHGQTSHIPKGLPVHYLEYILTLRYLFKTIFKWDEISLLGHSFGSSICFAYAGLFPDHVKKMVNMECSRFWTAISIDRFLVEYRKSLEGFSQDYENDISDSLGFSWEESVDRIYKARITRGLPLSKKSCEIIAKRGTVKVSKNKFIFSHDKRLKFSSLSRFTNKQINELSVRICCESLNLEASNGLVSLMTDPSEWHNNLQTISANSKLVNVVVEGGHHVHLETPEAVAPVLNDFFKHL